jgi:hypothetical protein
MLLLSTALKSCWVSSETVIYLPEGAAITNLIGASAQEAHRELAEEVKRSIIFLVNKQTPSWKPH